MDARRQHYLSLMQIPVWQQRQSGELADTVSADVAAEQPVADDVTPQPSEPQRSERERWNALQEAVRICTLCELHRTRNNTVFGVGGRPAKLMFIGEAPGEREDQMGEPFVGAAGQLLNAMLRAIGLERDDVFIANILKCRPPRNRDPSAEETATCTPYLTQQIELLRPQLLIALGRVAAQYLLQSTTPIGRLRGRVHAYGEAGLPLLVTYHPAYLLRSPAEKRRAWEDLKLMREWLRSGANTVAHG